MILQEANRAKNSRIRDINERANPLAYRTFTDGAAVNQMNNKKWNHYMDTKF